MIDNGGSAVRGGFTGQSLPRRVIPNCVGRGKRGDKRLFIGERILNSPLAEYLLTRPVTRGLVTDWECQKVVWEGSLFVRNKFGNFQISSEIIESTTVILSTAAFTPPTLRQEAYDVLFEDYRFSRGIQFDSSIAAQFSPGITCQFTPDDWGNPCGLIIDVGFSFTTVVPVFSTQPVAQASQRTPVAGQVLNNLLKERISYAQIDLEDNPLLIENIKEQCCYVSQDFRDDLEGGKFSKIFYSLPDFSSQPPFTGSVVASLTDLPPGHQFVELSSERIVIPECLFSPRSFGVDRPSVVETIVQAVLLCDPVIREAVCRKIIVVGGTSMMTGFLDRLSAELEPELKLISPSLDKIRLITESDGRNDLSVWRGLSQIASNETDLEYLGLINRQNWGIKQKH